MTSLQQVHSDTAIIYIRSYVILVTVGDDYRCNDCNHTLVAGMRSVSFTINIFDDNILELDEELMLTDISTFFPKSSGIRVITGSPESTVVIIIDNDCESFCKI